MTRIKEIIAHLETVAPPQYQESYDNAGLITGDPDWEASGAVISLDATEEVVREAVRLGYNLVIAHHPIVFKGLKKLNGKTYVERTVIRAIQHNVAIYAIHTNLDNVYHQGVNAKIAARLGLEDTRILVPKKEARHMSIRIPSESCIDLQQELIRAGATSITLLPTLEDGFVQLNAHFTSGGQAKIMKAVRNHLPDSLPAFHTLDNDSPEIGSGMIGSLPAPVSGEDFLDRLKSAMQTACIRHTRLLEKPIRKVALCGGAGSFLLPHAIRQGADAYVTGDFKYHEFFDADGQLVIADIGHFESEQFTIELLHEIIEEKFPNFALHLTEVKTNPVFYR